MQNQAWTCLWLAGGLLVACAPFCPAETLWLDDFSTDRSAEYKSFPIISPGFGVVENRMEFSFDFGAEKTSPIGTERPAAAIPPAPGSTDQKALLLEVNHSAANFQGITVMPPVVVPAGVDFAVEADVFFRLPGNPAGGYEGEKGATQFYMIGINHQVAAPQPPSIVVKDANVYGDGYVWTASGDGGWVVDYALGRGSNPFARAQVLWGKSAYDPFALDTDLLDNGIAAENSSGPFAAVYPAAQFPYPKGAGGACGDRWTKVRMVCNQAKGEVVVLLDGQQVATYADPARTYFAGGLVSVSLYDPTNSSAPANNRCYLLVDNLRIDVLRPGATAQ